MRLSKKKQIFLLFAKNAYAAYTSSLCSGAEALTNRFEFFINIRVGNLVMETTNRKDLTKNIGWLRKIKKDKSGFHTYTLELLYDNTKIKWFNANFVRVLDLKDDFSKISQGV